jgi:predicted RNA-binding protein with PUA-like domain
MPNYWLMKTEPDVFSFDDLIRCKNRTDSWDGIRNYQARNMMRDDFKRGDKVFIYHSRIPEPAIVGVAEVVKESHPDPSALDPKSKYFDDKSKSKGESRWCMVDVMAVERFRSDVTIQQCRETTGLEEMALIKKGQRLSIQPVSASEWKVIRKLGKPEKV